MGNKHNVVAYESNLTSIDELSINDDSDNGYISSNASKDIWDRNYAHSDINARDCILKIINHIRQDHSEWNVAEL